MTIDHRPLTTAVVLLLAFAVPVSGQAPRGTVRGIVVDARDGTPLEKVSVRIQDSKLATITTSDGRFQLDEVPAGRHELFVSAVDFVLIRRTVEVPAGDVLDITIPITAGTGTYTETVDVSTAAGPDDRGTAGGEQVLRSHELQQLRGGKLLPARKRTLKLMRSLNRLLRAATSRAR